MDNQMGAVMTKYQLIVPLTEAEKAKYEAKRRSEGKTSQGCIRKLVLGYIGEAEHDERSNG